jgi:hypothetical protein
MTQTGPDLSCDRGLSCAVEMFRLHRNVSTGLTNAFYAIPSRCSNLNQRTDQQTDQRLGPTNGITKGPTNGPTSGSTKGITNGPTKGPTKGPTSGPTTGTNEGTNERTYDWDQRRDQRRDQRADQRRDQRLIGPIQFYSGLIVAGSGGGNPRDGQPPARPGSLSPDGAGATGSQGPEQPARVWPARPLTACPVSRSATAPASPLAGAVARSTRPGAGRCGCGPNLRFRHVPL